MKKILAPILALLVVVLAGIAYHFYHVATVATQSLAAALADRDSQRTRLTETEKRREALQTEIGELRANSAPTRGPAQRLPMAASARAEFVGAPPHVDSPEMRRMMAIAQNSRLDARYAALFKALGLPPAQLDRFKQLLLDKQNAQMDVFASAHSQGVTSREQIDALLRQTNGEIDDSIRSLLGDAAYQQYQQYAQTEPQRNLVDQLSTRLSYTDSPLTSQQAAQLTQLLSATSTNASSENPTMTVTESGDGFVSFNNRQGATISDEAIAQAQGLLSASQLQALQQLQAEQQAKEKMGQMMMMNIGSMRPARVAAPMAPP